MPKYPRPIWLRLAAPVLAGLVAAAPLPAAAQTEDFCQGQHQAVSPALTDLGAQTYTRTGTTTPFAGGLYPGGANTRPPAHESAGQALAAQVVPRNASGQPDPQTGKIGLVSVGMSNTASEFRTFRTLALADPAMSPAMVLVNGATAGQTAEYWTDPLSPNWTMLHDRVVTATLTDAQVQVAWVKLTRTGLGLWPNRPQLLQTDLAQVARNLRTHFPNLKLAYFSSRTRSYTYEIGLSPEPAAFESGFAVKWLIEQQLNGDPSLNFDPNQGAAVAPWLAWGPYLWVDGLNPRGDGQTWPQTDLVRDCTHPSDSGNHKVGQWLLHFFKTDTTTRHWFLADPAAFSAVYMPGVWGDFDPALAAPWLPGGRR